MVDVKDREHIDNFINMQIRGARVISGRVIGQGGEGAIYELDNNEYFKFTADECRALASDGYPKWKGIH